MTESDLLDTVFASPDRLEPRLVLADWLLERANPRGELIALQCKLEGAPISERPALQKREQELLRAHGRQWLADLELREGEGTFVRGFVEELNLAAPRLERVLPALHGRARVRSLRLTRLRKASELLPVLKYLPWLVSLDIRDSRLGNDGIRLLLASPHLARLENLNVTRNNLGPAAAEAIATVPLVSLDAQANSLGLDGVQALASAPGLARLIELNLHGNNLGPSGAAALAGSPYLAHLRKLELGLNSLGDDGVLALAGSPAVRELTELRVQSNRIGAPGARGVAGSPCLARLTALDLSFNDIGAGAQAFVEPTSLPHLALLDLRMNGLRGRGIHGLRVRFGDGLSM